MKVMIATPVYGDTVSSGYHTSILDTIGFFAREFPHIEFAHQVRSTSFFPQVRNVVASEVLNDPSYTHLLLVDQDIAFRPDLIAKMLAFGRPVVSAIYPEKRRDYDRFRAAVRGGATPLEAELGSGDYVYGGDAVVTTPGAGGVQTIDVVDGFVRVTRAGTGLLLIARSALETMRERLADLWIPEPAEWVASLGLRSGGYFQCFSVETGSNGIEVGSDVAFSRRWVEGCGGEIWSCVDEAIVRTGVENFLGHYYSRLEERAGDKHIILVQKSAQAAS